MKTKIYLILLTSMLLSSNLFGQQNDFVSLDGKKFMYQCQEFYPKVMNICIGLNKDTNTGEEFITPYFYYRNDPNYGISYSKSESRKELRAQMQMIKDLGFNCIRLLGYEIYEDKDTKTLMIHYPTPWGLNLNETLATADYHHIFGILDSIFALAAEENLKVIYLVGAGKADRNETNIEQYRNYLDSVAKHFSNQPALMAYDIYNEPHLYARLNAKDTIFNTILQWYRAIRDNTPNQLVTIGLGDPGCVMTWDHSMMPLDFISVHYYARTLTNEPDTLFKSTAAYFKWMGENISKPWIIGETGFPSDTATYDHLKTTYQQTAEFAEIIKDLNQINGSSGFSWWSYQDLHFFDNNSTIAGENYYGLMNRRNDNKPFAHTQTSDTALFVDGLRKLDSTVFVEYNPSYTAPNAPLPDNYYNILGYNYTACQGTVTGPNGPLKDAVIFGWKIHPAINWKEASQPIPTNVYDFYSTFSDGNGHFVLKTDHPEIPKLCGLWVSYPLMNRDPQWDERAFIPETVNVTLTNLDLNYGAGITEFNDYIIKSGDTIEWTSPATMAGNLVIKEGGQLTVKGNVYFNSNNKVVVEPGGKLIVDGGRLTSGCEDGMWVGVEVQGNPEMPLTATYQGYIEMKDSARIENAEIGIHCVLNEYNPTEDGPPSFASGGIINANVAFFKNNSIGIEIEQYLLNISYNSTIKNSTFEYNDTITSELELIYIKLTSVYDVNIFTNKFEGNIANAFNNRGTGIAAYDATFDLNDNDPPTSNDFNNMTYGIACYNTNAYSSPEINLTNFTDCWRAIYLSGVTSAKVLANTISYKSQNSSSGNQAYGIYLDNCNKYKVEMNVLTSSDDNNKPENGIVINNSGSDNNYIYRNTFTKIKTPLNAQNINRVSGGSTGLQLLCNIIDSCTVNDIVVTYETSNSNNGIRQDQGKYVAPMKPAGNLFTAGGKTYKNYTNSSPNQVHYAHYLQSGVIYYESIPHYVTPKITSTVTNHNTQIQWDSSRWVGTDCPDTSGISGGGKSLNNFEGLKGQIYKLQAKIDSASAALQEKMNHGNTQQLINRINTCGTSGYQLLYNDLRNYSPYLSEEVLLAIIHKQGFPTNMLVNLMLVNTHVAKDPILMDALQYVQPSIPEGQLKQIEKKINVFSEMEFDRMKIADLIEQRDKIYNHIESFYAHDSIVSSGDSLIVMLNWDPRLTAKYELIYHYLVKDDSTNANMLLNRIPQLYVLNDYEQTEYAKYKQLFELKKQLKGEGKDFNKMSEHQQQMLINVINNPSLSIGEMSDLNALRQVNGVIAGKIKGKSPILNYKEPILEPLENKELIADNSEKNEIEELKIEGIMDQVLLEENSLQLFPNPASEEVNVFYNTSVNVTKVSIEISDVTGRIINSFALDKNNNLVKINTQSYKQGLYYVMLIVDGKKQKVEKLVIQ